MRDLGILLFAILLGAAAGYAGGYLVTHAAQPPAPREPGLRWPAPPPEPIRAPAVPVVHVPPWRRYPQRPHRHRLLRRG